MSTGRVILGAILLASCLALGGLSAAGCSPFGALVEEGHPEVLVGDWEDHASVGVVSLSLRADGTSTETISGWPGLGTSTAEGTWAVEDGKLVLRPFLYSLFEVSSEYTRYSQVALRITWNSPSGYALKLDDGIRFEKKKE